MKMLLQKISNRILEQDMPVDAIFKTLTAVIIIRTVLEKLLSTGHRLLFDPVDFYSCLVGDLHMYFSWVCIFLSMSIPVAVFLRVRYRDALKLTLIGFCVTVTVPFVDFIFTGGVGDEIRYFRNFDTFFYNYVNLFNPLAAMKGVTTGVRLEVATVFFGSLIFPLFGFRRGIVRSLLLAFSLYTIVYLYGYILPFHHLIGIDLTTMTHRSTTVINGTQALFFAYLIPFALCLVGAAAILAWRENAGKVILSVLYPRRLLFYLLLLCFGLMFTAWQVGHYPKILNIPDMLKLVSAAFSISLLFIYAKLINDINDLDIDRVSNRERPLVEGLMSKDDAGCLAFMAMALSLVLAIPVGRDFSYFWFFIWGLSYVYSTPPFRFRRFWPLNNLVIAVIGTGVFMAGASIARPDDFYAALKDKEIIAYVLLAFFFCCHLKDLKDIDGDQAGGIFNLFGHVPSPRALALIFFGAFMVLVLFIASLVDMLNAAVITGTIICVAVSTGIVLKSKDLAGLDRLFVVSFIFLVYIAVVWLIHLGR